MVQPSTAITSP